MLQTRAGTGIRRKGGGAVGPGGSRGGPRGVSGEPEGGWKRIPGGTFRRVSDPKRPLFGPETALFVSQTQHKRAWLHKSRVPSWGPPPTCRRVRDVPLASAGVPFSSPKLPFLVPKTSNRPFLDSLDRFPCSDFDDSTTFSGFRAENHKKGQLFSQFSRFLGPWIHPPIPGYTPPIP